VKTVTSANDLAVSPIQCSNATAAKMRGFRLNTLSDLSHVFDIKNLRRAYRWIMSNPDAQYKGYFRDAYEAFAIASETHLRWLRQEGLKERYEASHASKILVPKPSGTLRPISLLTVDDQIIYQACINIVADVLKKKTRKRYGTRVFAHLYAGRSSPFFYRRWQTSYLQFSRQVIGAYAKGYIYIANFDLTAFYDSIDHNVLRHFLTDIGIDEDLIEFILESLRKWTSSTWSNGPQNIYHGHGIPQGPLSSGMLSEAVLQHLDEAGEQGGRTIYLRYVDDIKILARTEDELRRKLIKLDISAKEIGLFPQTSKINIRKIANPDDEVKSVSRPPEPSVTPKVDQAKLISRVLQMSRQGQILPAEVTRFKYLVAHANPSHRLNQRLMKVLGHQPELASTVSTYITKYKTIPKTLASAIIEYVQGEELYHSVNGALLRACLGRMPSSETAQLGQWCADRLVRPKRGAIRVQPSYKEALLAWALTTRTLAFAEYERVLFDELDWWVQKCALRELAKSLFGPGTYADLINRSMRVVGGELARIAAARLLQDAVRLGSPYGGIDAAAKRTLKAAGVIRSAGQPETRIHDILAYILGRKRTSYGWKKFFGKEHRHAERMMIFLKRNRESNIDAFLVQMDSFCDLLTAEVFGRVVVGKNYPAYGSALAHPTLLALLPVAMAAFHKLHALRLESTTAHPRTKTPGKPTRRLKHSDFYKLRPEMINAFDEFERVIGP
jgi:hypothetical protein